MGHLVALLCAFALTPVARAQTVSSTHPRIWLTPDRLTRLKDYASRNGGQGTTRWQTLLGNYNANFIRYQVNAGNTGVIDNSDNIPPVALAYQVTGDTTYAAAAIVMLMAGAVASNDLTRDSCYDYRYLPNYVAGFDWCYDQMTAAQRTQVAAWLMDRADYVWPETNPARVGAWGLWPSNNYYWGFMMTWPAALAAYGDDPRAATHLNLALSRFQNEVKPWAAGWGKGGMFAEGTNYDSTHYMGQILDAHLTATGQDLINAADFTYLTESLYWRIHSTTPSLDHEYHLGDHSQHSTVDGSLYDYDRWRVLFSSFNLQDPVLKSYAKSWLDTITPSACSQSFTVTWEFLNYNEDIVAADYTKTLPLSYFASGPGVYLKRSDWTPSATYWGIWAGDLLESHQNRDINGFLIYKGGALAGNACMWSADGVYPDTLYHNNFTFSGSGQLLQSSAGNGKALKVEDTAEYGYFAGQGAGGYAGSVAVSDYVRKMVNVSPNLFMIYDRVTLGNAALSKDWHLHSLNPVAVDGRSYTFDNGNYRLFGQSVLPTTGVTVTADGVQPFYDTTVTSYEAVVTTNATRTTDYMLNVLQLGPMSQTSAPTPQAVVATTGNMEGALCGNWVVMFGKTESVTDAVTYPLNAGIATQHLVLDLVPTSNYLVTLANRTTGVNHTGVFTATSQGSLRFPVDPGPVSVSLATTSLLAPSVSLSALALSPATVTSSATAAHTTLAAPVRPSPPGSGSVSGSSTATVTLTGPAPPGGSVVSISANSSLVTVPATVTVAAGATSATFGIVTSAVKAPATATVSVSYQLTSRAATLTVLPPSTVSLSALTVNPVMLVTGSSASARLTAAAGGPSPPVGGTVGAASTGTVLLTSAAPPGGVVARLSSNSTVVSVPASVTVPSGATTATFPITSTSVRVLTLAVITATYQSATRSAALVIVPPSPVVLQSLVMNPSSITGGGPSTGTVAVTPAAPTGGAVVKLSTSSALAVVPPTVLIAAGQSTATFSATSGAVAVNTTAIITATYQSVTKTATLTIAPGPGHVPACIWSDTALPNNPADPQVGSLELGLKFRSDIAGYVQGIRFYKSTTNTGVHTGTLWSQSGQLLATTTFTDETAAGWQMAAFAAPVLILPNTTYVASYHTDTGHYSDDSGYFSSAGHDNGPLHALRDGVDGSNGVYAYGTGVFPTLTWMSSNYWVDIVFGLAP